MAAQSININHETSNTHLHNGINSTLPPADLHRAHVNNCPLPTKGINDRKGYIERSSLGGLLPAFFLICYGLMYRQNIIFLEEADITDGALDGASDAEQGYIVCGGRKIELIYKNF
jgi:oleate hydratase